MAGMITALPKYKPREWVLYETAKGDVGFGMIIGGSHNLDSAWQYHIKINVGHAVVVDEAEIKARLTKDAWRGTGSSSPHGIL